MGIGPFVIVADALPSKLQNKLVICNETKISKLWSLILVNHYFWHYNRVSTILKKNCQYEIGIFSRFPTFYRIVNTLHHTVQNLHFLSKNSTWISRENCWFFWVKNSWKCCSFGLFSCWQLWFHEKNCQKNFGWKTRENVGVLSKLNFWTKLWLFE